MDNSLLDWPNLPLSCALQATMRPRARRRSNHIVFNSDVGHKPGLQRMPLCPYVGCGTCHQQ